MEGREANSASEIDRLNAEKIEKAKRGFLGFFVARYRFIIILLIGITLWGLFGLSSLPREANPEVEVPFAVIITAFPGASPTDVEELLTDKIEERAKNVENVKLVTSNSSLSVSTVNVEFEASADLDKSVADLKDAIEELRDLPKEAEEPQVIELNFNNQSVVTISLVGELTDAEFKRLADLVKEELESINGVSEVTTAGVREREITVALNPGELERLNISISQIVAGIQAANTSIPLGDVVVDETSYNVRTTGKFRSERDLKNIVVKAGPESVVLLGDVAEIQNELREKKSLSLIGVGGADPLPAISFQIFKKTGGNIIEVVDASRQKLEGLKAAGVIPEKLAIEVTNDFSQFIRDDLNTLGRSALQTIAIIFVLLTLALNFRQGVLGALSIPLVFLMSFGMLALAGATLNSLTLFSLVLSMGLLVDSMIVILEGIHDGILQGMKPRDAALYSIETYKWPITAGVLTTISAFVPMFLVSGIVGEFLKTFPTTVAITLFSSLAVGLLILPGVVAVTLRRAGKPGEKERRSLMERYAVDKIRDKYRRFIDSILISRKKKWTFVSILMATFILAAATLPLGLIPVELFPNIDVDFLYVNIELPVGQTLAATAAVAKQTEREIAAIPEVKNYVANIGAGIVDLNNAGPMSPGSENKAQIVVNLTDLSERDRKSRAIARDLRQRLTQINGAKITVEEPAGGPPTGAPIEARVTGDNLAEVRSVARATESLLKKIEGAVNVNSDDRITPPEFSFVLDHERLGRFGLSAASVGTSLRASLEGVTATEINIDGDDVDVVVKLKNTDAISIGELKNLSVISPTGRQIKFDEIASFEITPALESIRHRDLKRIISVRADADGVSPGEVTAKLNKRLAELNLPQGVEVSLGGEVEDINRSFTELWYSMSLAVILIFLIMVLQFNSYRQPFIILMTLPLAVIGVIFGTLVLGLSFGFATFLGVVALGGIVVNDAIVLIDRINYNINVRNLELREAITEAGQSRLQPIIMTTLTTIAGVTPLAFVDEFWRGLSVAIAFGIAFATILTLVLMPILYQKMQGKRWLLKQQGAEENNL